jgi:MFS family permease
LYRISPLGCVGAGVGGFMSGAFMGLGPVFGRQVGLSLTEITVFMAASMLGGLLLQWPLGRLSDRLGRRPTIVGTCVALGALGLGVTMMAARSELAIVALVLAWGGLAFALYPLCLALSNDFIKPEELIGTGAGLLLVNGIGMILGPILVSQLMAWQGPQMLFLTMALLGLALALFGAWRHRVGVPLPLEAQSEYVVVPTGSPLATMLDPRAEDPQLELPLGPPVLNDGASEPAGEAEPAVAAVHWLPVGETRRSAEPLAAAAG